jgi:hypothetical protein
LPLIEFDIDFDIDWLLPGKLNSLSHKLKIVNGIIDDLLSQEVILLR